MLSMAASLALEALSWLYGADEVQQVPTRGLEEVTGIMALRMMLHVGQQAFNKLLQQLRMKQKRSPNCRTNIQSNTAVILSVALDSALTIYLSTFMTTKCLMLTKASMRMMKKGRARGTPRRTGTTKTPTRKKPP